MKMTLLYAARIVLGAKKIPGETSLTLPLNLPLLSTPESYIINHVIVTTGGVCDRE